MSAYQRCLIIHNRQTRYNEHPAKAYSLMAESILEVVFSNKRHKRRFEQKPGLPSSTDESDGYAVAENYCVNVPDSGAPKENVVQNHLST